MAKLHPNKAYPLRRWIDGFGDFYMRILFGVVLVAGGAVLFLSNAIHLALVKAYAGERYHDVINEIPVKQSYSRAEYTSAAWNAWTNRMRLPAQETYTPGDLKEALFSLNQDPCDRSSLEHLVAEACDYNTGLNSNALVGGVLAMVVGAFTLGTVTGRKRPVDDAENRRVPQV